jgi:GH25 family lysozyme M1 (1,4-beta-N-acetylmuramidase)
LHLSGLLGPNDIKKGGITVSLPKPVILDISEWQVPSKIDYDKIAKDIVGVIIRVQYGSNYVDKHYKTHINEFKKRGIPIAVYAWVRGTSYSDMETEATDFYNRAKEFAPAFWWLDVEEWSMTDMRGGCERYRAKLKTLGVKKVGAYIANHMYHGLNLDTAKFDGIWIPTYGSNNGQYNGSNPTATFAYDIHQYTSNGELSGYDGPLDLNRLANVGKGLEYYFGSKTATKPESGTTVSPKVEQGGINVKTITTTTDKVKLRSAAKVANNVIAELPKGSQVKINDIVIADGIIWGVQPRTNNQKGYIDLGKPFGWIK